jgi:hypothetical protein
VPAAEHTICPAVTKAFQVDWPVVAKNDGTEPLAKFIG